MKLSAILNHKWRIELKNRERVVRGLISLKLTRRLKEELRSKRSHDIDKRSQYIRPCWSETVDDLLVQMCSATGLGSSIRVEYVAPVAMCQCLVLNTWHL